jgi:hypothetical protein
MDDFTSKLLLIHEAPIYQDYVKYVDDVGNSSKVYFSIENKPFIVIGKGENKNTEVYTLPYYEYIRQTIEEKKRKKEELFNKLRFLRNKLIYEYKIDEDTKFKYENMLHVYDKTTREIQAYELYQKHHWDVAQQKEDEMKKREKEFWKMLNEISETQPFSKVEYMKTLKQLHNTQENRIQTDIDDPWQDVYIKTLPMKKQEHVEQTTQLQDKVKKPKRVDRKKVKPIKEKDGRDDNNDKNENEKKPKRAYKRKQKVEMKGGKSNSILKSELKHVFVNDIKKFDEVKNVIT